MPLPQASSIFQGKWSSPKPNKVLIVDGEMPLVVMQERLARISTSETPQSITEQNLMIITPDLHEKGIPDISALEGQQLIEEHLNGHRQVVPKLAKIEKIPLGFLGLSENNFSKKC